MGLTLMPARPGAWQALTLSAPATQRGDADTVSCRVENGDTIRFRGAVTISDTYAGGGTILTLPAGFRPAKVKRLGARTQTGANFLIVNTDGTVAFSGSITTTHWASLDGLVFTL